MSQQPEAGANNYSGFTNIPDNYIDTLDIKKGISNFGGDKKSYMKILASFAANTPPLFEKIKHINADYLADKKNLSSYDTTVHGIKGASKSICAIAMADTAEALERAAKSGNVDFILKNNDSFIKNTEKFIVDLDKMLKEADSENPKPKKDKPDSLVLSRLLAACESYDIDEVDAAMEEIESYSYENDDGLALWIKKNVKQLNFKEIVEKLSALSLS